MEKMTTLEKLQFLAKIAEIRNTQPTDCNRNPVFWLIRNEVEERCDLSEAEHYSIHLEGKYLAPADYDESDLDTLKEDISSEIENFGLPDDEAAVDWVHDELIAIQEAATNASCIKDIIDAIEQNPTGADVMGYVMDITGYQKVHRVVYDHIFLTKEAAKQHLKDYHYRYTNPQTYANTALDSPETEQILNLLADSELWSELLKLVENASAD